VLYPDDIEFKLGFSAIRNQIADRCLSPLGAELTDNMVFMTDINAIELEHNRTFEFVKIIQNGLDFPSDNFFDLRPVFSRIRPQGTYPIPEEVLTMKLSLRTLKTIALFFKSDEKKQQFPHLSETASKLKLYPFVFDLTDKIVGKTATIRDNASPELARIRRAISDKQQQVSKVVAQLFRQAQSAGWADPDSQPVIRDGRLMIPILAPFKRQIRGIIHDESTTGKTVFIEPGQAVEINNAIREDIAEEKREIRRILIAFADEIRPYLADLSEAYAILGIFDFTRAKSLLSISLNANKITIIDEPIIELEDAVNPILYLNFKSEQKTVVPLSITLIPEERILLISGPNAGGKSVALKSVGILQYMMQCGIPIPARDSSRLGIFKSIFINIGDDQSIDNDLSTYSSHLLHMKQTLRHCNNRSLVLIDEFGSGTEPVIGGAIAEAILDKLNESHVFGVITTHYSNLKHYASQTPGIANGAMMFDTAKIEPTFKLEQGKPGGSFAIEIAHKIGLPTDVINDAKNRAGEDTANFDKHLREILRDKKYYEDKRDQIRRQEKRLEEVIQKQLQFLDEAQKTKSEIKKQSRDEAEKFLAEVNKRVESAIREIRESQADKEKTSAIRKDLESLRQDIKNGKKSKSDTIDLQIENVHRVARKHNIATKKDQEESKPKVLEKGDYVKIVGQTTIGQIIEISAKIAAVAFGDFITTVSPKKLEYLSNNQARKELRGSQKSQFNSEMSKKRISFRPHIDVRGKFADEAIMLIGEFIDSAIMVDAKELKILHGRGSGILRQVIREYLKTVHQVQSVADEHIEQGGDGISVVKLH